MNVATAFKAEHPTRVGILTLHYGYNEGAVLQASCLAAAVRSLGADVSAEILDHRYPGKLAKYGPARDARTRALQTYVDHQLPLSPERFESNRIGPTLRYAATRYTHLLIGSDQVWRLRYSRRILGLARLQTDAFHPAFPNLYWAAPKSALKCSAYAASMGTFSVSDAPPTHQRGMARSLAAFDRLGLRDQNTEDQVRQLLGPDREMNRVPDPTFLTEPPTIDPKALYAKFDACGLERDRPVCAVIAAESDAITGLCAALHERGIQTAALTAANSACGLQLWDAGFSPTEWAATVGHADLLVSERMHGLASALQRGTPCVAIDRDASVGASTRIGDLMGVFDLANAVCTPQDDAAALLRAIDFAEGQDPTHTEATHQQLRAHGLNFLRDALGVQG